MSSRTFQFNLWSWFHFSNVQRWLSNVRPTFAETRQGHFVNKASCFYSCYYLVYQLCFVLWATNTVFCIISLVSVVRQKTTSGA